MSNSTFLVANIPETQNPNYSTYMMDINYDHHHHHQGFELSDYLALADHPEEDSTSSFTACLSQTPISQEITSGSSVNSIGNVPRSSTDHIKCKNGMKRIKMDVGYRIAFRTQSELEVMDDGYKWRKYGKKRVKNSPNPRNYYKCSTGGCNVKKRVERDGEDSSYVITTYEGVHNHESPCVVYYHEMPPFSLPTAWSLIKES